MYDTKPNRPVAMAKLDNFCSRVNDAIDSIPGVRVPAAASIAEFTISLASWCGSVGVLLFVVVDDDAFCLLLGCVVLGLPPAFGRRSPLVAAAEN